MKKTYNDMQATAISHRHSQVYDLLVGRNGKWSILDSPSGET